MENYLIEKIARVLNGETVICSNNDLSIMEAHEELYQRGLYSNLNPNQHGILDRYLVRVKRPLSFDKKLTPTL